MKKGLTELVFVIDESGSMYDLTQDTIGGFNSAIDRQKQTDGEVYVSTILFNDRSRMLHDRLPLSDVQSMTESDYHASGCTALVDAMGSSIRHIRNIHKYARNEDVPEHTVFIITTDGMENASHIWTAAEVRQMVEVQKDKYGWEFVFLAANIDAAETAARYGIDSSRAVNYRNDSHGTRLKFKAVGNAVDACRMNVPLEESGWKDELEEDYLSRPEVC